MATLAGKRVGTTGYGMMGLTWRSEVVSNAEALDVMHEAIRTGSNFFNGGEIYGSPERNSLHLLNEYFSKYPEDAETVVISIKGGFNDAHQPDGSAEGVRRSVENCLYVLDGKKKLDLWECGRVDPNRRIEDTIEALAEFVKEGKIGGISLSEVGPNAIRRAAKVHKIDAVEVEFSLFCTEILENGVAQACAENGITIVAYSPLSRGFLSGKVKTPEDLPDRTRFFPRFQGGNFQKNMELVREVEKVAEAKGCAVSQVAIAWIKQQSGKNGLPTIIPIPGSTTPSRVKLNNTDVRLTDAEMDRLNTLVKQFTVHGDRYPAQFQSLNFGEGI